MVVAHAWEPDGVGEAEGWGGATSTEPGQPRLGSVHGTAAGHPSMALMRQRGQAAAGQGLTPREAAQLANALCGMPERVGARQGRSDSGHRPNGCTRCRARILNRANLRTQLG
jgi:hypothetical protein